MSFFLTHIAPKLKKHEGGFVDHKSDRGGPTHHGITERVARMYGYRGDMREMPWSAALEIYEKRYFIEPGFNSVATINGPVAVELTDTGVNMGQHWPAVFFQTALNRFNRRGRDYRNIKVDGDVGPATLTAFDAYMKRRGKLGELVMLRALNTLQGDRYFDVTPEDDQNEDFIFGWFANRVAL